MPQSGTNPKVDVFLSQSEQWRQEFEALREIVLDCSFTEELKWGVPCYTIDGRNVVLIHGFKEYCALLFFKGALLRDPQGILIRQTVNVQASRQIRFTGVQEITELKPILKDYLLEAIVVEKAGLDVEWNETSEFSIPEELQQKFDEISGLKDAFEALTPGRQRAYLLYFSEAKQAKTRVARVEKYLPAIFSGKGLHD
jgi:uncharacterized protein YdeI (YjbR/CyaY-like superfamily)